MKRKLSAKEYTYVASMLFGLFFGAGNLIFPVHLGQMAGSNVWQAILGLLITGVGLPLLGVIPEDPDVPYCLNRGLVLREQNYYAARAYENIAKRIMGQKTPLMKI